MTKAEEIKQIAAELQQYLTDPDSRLYVCRESILLFGLYYFEEYITYDLADFHYDMIGDIDDLKNLTITELLWIIFREGTKTSWAKIVMTYFIVYGLRHYMLWDSVDSDNVEAALLDVATELQTNPRIIEDFGQLYIEEASKYKGKTQKKITSFITKNGIKVQGLTVGKSGRGRVFGKYRPDFVVFDDFETEKTVDSRPMTRKIRKHIDTIKAGMAPNGIALYLANLISEAGNVKQLMDSAANNPKLRVRIVNAEIDGKPAWPEKYVMTDRELEKKPYNPEAPMISLESRKRMLNADGRKVYETEMMNSPEAAGDMFFDRRRVDEAIERAKKIQPIDEIGDTKYYAKYNPSHRYAIGSDSAGGRGRDSCTAAGIDFTQNPNCLFATYKSNEIQPDIFAFELRTIGKKFGECYIAPEINNHGNATVTKLKDIYPADKIHRRTPTNKTEEKPTKLYGWETTSANRADMLYRYRTAFDDGVLVIDDLGLLKEMRSFTKGDVDNISIEDGTTRHFDLLIAASICWAVGRYVPDPAARKRAMDYKQKPFENPSAAAPAAARTPGSDFGDRFAKRDENPYNDFEQPAYDS